MGTLLQLMALPAACMLVAWARGGGAAAVGTALRRLVAMIAVRDMARARVPNCVASGVARKASKAIRVSVRLGVERHGAANEGRVLREATASRAGGALDPDLRMRRIRPRWATGNTGT